MRITLILILLMGMSGVHATGNKVVNVYTWSGYIPDSVIQKFEEETGIRVNYSTYVNNEVLYAKLKANPDSDYDVIMPSSYFADRMIKQGILQKIDYQQLVNAKQLDSIFPNPTFDPKNEYSVPYLWTSTGIVVNAKYYEVNQITKWLDLWDPQYRDKLLVLDDAREDFSMALLTLGYSVNDENEQHIRAAFERLKSLMRNIKIFNSDTQHSIYLDEDITLGMGWNGDIYLAARENPALKFVYPEEGFIVSIDGFAIPKSAKHVENAHRFIDFVLQESIAKKICLETGFSTVNRNVISSLPEAIRNNPISYPDAETMKRAAFQADVGKAVPIYEKYFERLKLEQ